MSAMAFWYYITLLFSGEENTYHVYQPVCDGMMRRRTVCLSLNKHLSNLWMQYFLEISFYFYNCNFSC